MEQILTISLDQQQLILIAIGLLVGLLLGGLVIGLRLQRKLAALATQKAVVDAELKTQEILQAEREQALETAAEHLALSFDAMASKTMRDQSDTFLKIAEEHLSKHSERAKSTLAEREKAVQALVSPIAEALQKTGQQISTIEKERKEAFGAIRTHLETMATTQQTLQLETRNLVTALRRPEVRGQWGEFTLRRVVELSGMVEHCDFFEQQQVTTATGTARPDMVVHMPEERQLVVDAKTPMDAYIEAIEAVDDSARKAALARHAKNVRDRIKELSSKAYWEQFPHSPEFVILFVPGDQFLAAALDLDPGMQEDAFRQKVFLTTPTSLVGLLKVIAYGWRQLALAKNAEVIRDLGEELYRRLNVFTTHLARLGKQIGSTVDSFNSAVGSLERKVLPGARKFGELGIQTPAEITTADAIDKTTRSVNVSELAAPDDTASDEKPGSTPSRLPDQQQAEQ